MKSSLIYSCLFFFVGFSSWAAEGGKLNSLPTLSPAKKLAFTKIYLSGFDQNSGTWGRGKEKKNLPHYALEYAFELAALSDPQYKSIAKKTLQGIQTNIPQVKELAIFHWTRAYEIFQDRKHIKSAKKTYLSLSKSQRTLKRSAQTVLALGRLYEVTKDLKILKDAEEVANWILKNLSGHDQKVQWMAAKAFLQMYQDTADREWLQHAIKTAEQPHPKTTKASSVLERVDQARLANLLYHYTGDRRFQKTAHSALNALSKVQAQNFEEAAGILLADIEGSKSPIHITVVGSKTDPKAKALFHAAIQYPGNYKRIEWWDKSEGPLLNPDVQYPQLSMAAAFACSKQSCSLPVFDPKQVAKAANRLFKKKG